MSRDYSALVAYLAARSAMPFAWGSNDCVTFAAGAVKAMTGRDVLAELGTWSDEESARAAVEARGGLRAAVDKLLEPVPPALAQRGDIVGVPAAASAFGLLLMVVEGHTIIGPDANRVRRLPRTHAVAAWRAA